MKEATLTDHEGDNEIASQQVVTTGHRYSSAPIVEASIDLRVTLPHGTELDQLAAVYAGNVEMTGPEPFYAFSPDLTIDDGDEIVGTTSGKQLGYTFKAIDESFIVRSNLDRFSYSQLGIYTKWSDFLHRAEVRWEGYREALSPAVVSSVGVRFVNRIDIRKPQIEIKDYLRTSVDISPYLPQAVSGYFAQVGVPLPDFGAKSTITSAIVDSDEPGVTSLILDIDVTREVSLIPESPTFEKDLLATLARLREAKNFVFEACITDATRGLMS